MTIQLSLSAPEHAHLIVDYQETFMEGNAFRMAWDCGAIPRPGDVLDQAFIVELVGQRVNVEMLPKIWQVMDVRWKRDAGSIVPVLDVVGK